MRCRYFTTPLRLSFILLILFLNGDAAYATVAPSVRYRAVVLSTSAQAAPPALAPTFASVTQRDPTGRSLSLTER